MENRMIIVFSVRSPSASYRWSESAIGTHRARMETHASDDLKDVPSTRFSDKKH
jgi:hypothetical protein